MTLESRAGWLALVIATIFVIGSRGDDAVPSIHTAVSNAVADGKTSKTKQLGFSIARDKFSETNSRGGVLVGFELGMREWFDSETITAVRPIYQTAGGEVKGTSQGSFTVKQGGIKRVLRLRAKAGYAVGAVRLRTGLGIDAMSLTYYRISGDRLDAQRSYESDWVGNVGGGSEGTIEGGGMPFVGIFGNRGDRDRVNGLGLVLATLPPPRKAEKPAERPAEKAPAKAKQQDRPAEKQAPPASPKWTHRENELHFKLEVPAGWVRLTADEQQEMLRKAPGSFEPATIAFRDEKLPLGEAFVLLRSGPIEPGQRLDQIGGDLTPSEGPYREVKGASRDWARLVQLGEVIVDRERNRFAWRTSSDLAGGQVQTLHVCHVGAESAVTLECHARQDRFATALTSFAQISDSAAFDAAKAYQEPQKANSWWIPMVVFVGVSTVILVPTLYFGWRKKAPEKPSRRRPKRLVARLAAAEPGEAIPIAPLADEDVPLAELVEEEASPPRAFAPSTGIVAEVPSPSTPRNAPAQARARRDEPAEDPFTCVNERRYRVYVLPDEMYFIDDGPGDVQPAGSFLRPKFSDEQQPWPDERREPLARPTADELFALVDGETNFRIGSADVWQAAIEAPGYWDSLGEGVGTLRLGHRTRGEMTFRFRGTTDMHRAIELLRQALGHCLAVNAVWDKAKKKFVREA